MANFPSTIFDPTNPTSTSPRNDPSLAGEITGLNNEVVAIEEFLGTEGGNVVTEIVAGSGASVNQGQGVVTIATTGGGGGPWDFTGSGSPQGVQSASAVGQTYLNTVNGASFIATATGDSSWYPLGVVGNNISGQGVTVSSYGASPPLNAYGALSIPFLDLGEGTYLGSSTFSIGPIKGTAGAVFFTYPQIVTSNWSPISSASASMDVSLFITDATLAHGMQITTGGGISVTPNSVYHLAESDLTAATTIGVDLSLSSGGIESAAGLAYWVTCYADCSWGAILP